MPRRAYASVSSPRLYEDLPDRNREAIVESILTDRNMTNSVLMASLTGSVAAMRSMHRYSRGPNYHYGSPNVFTSLDNVEARDIWLLFLQAKYSPGTGEFFRVNEVGTAPEGTRRRVDVHGYLLLQDNPIATPDTFSRFEYDGTIARVYKTSGGVEVLHIEEESPIVGSIEHYVFWSRNEFDANDAAVLLGVGAEVYQETSGTMPGLHELGDPPPPLDGEMLPLIPIRINGVDYSEDDNVLGLEGSASIRQILRRGNADPVDILDAIKSNPDEDKIDDAYIGFGISMTETEEWAIAGLGAIFSSWYEANPNTETIFNDTSIRQNINITTDESGALDMILTYNFIRVTVLPGDPGYTKTFTEGVATEACFAPDVPGDPPVCSNTASTNMYTITRPLTGVNEGFYEEIVISGLVLLHAIYVEELDTIKAIGIVDNVDTLVIPLFKNNVFDVPNRLREDLVFGSMRMYIYSIEIVNLSWYETGIFKTILVIVALVLAVFTYGATLTAAFGLSTVAGLTALAKILAIALITDYGVQWLVEEVGGTLGLVLGIIFAVAVGGGKFDFTSLSSTINTTWYASFTAAVRVYGVHQTAAFNELADQRAEFEVEYEARLLELEAAEELLDFGTEFDFLKVIEYRSLPNTVPDEEPQQFYDRTSTTIDLAAISDSLVNNYHEAQLQLPTVDSFLPSHNFELGV